MLVWGEGRGQDEGDWVVMALTEIMFSLLLTTLYLTLLTF